MSSKSRCPFMLLSINVNCSADLDEDMYEGMEEDIDNGSHKICAQT